MNVSEITYRQAGDVIAGRCELRDDVRSFEEDTAYIVMEYLEGETLRKCIERSGKWTMREAAQCMSPVMKTLEKMHRRNIIHGEISPDKLIVLRDGSLKLLAPGTTEQWRDITLTRLAAGSCYSPPEKIDIRGISGSWSDVYSVCAVLYFCITGKDPEDAVSRLLLDDLKKPSEFGADIPPEAEKFLMRGMALDSKDRIRDMKQLRFWQSYDNLYSE